MIINPAFAPLVTVMKVVEVVLTEFKSIQDRSCQSIQRDLGRHRQPTPDAAAPFMPAGHSDLENVCPSPHLAAWTRVNCLPFRKIRLEDWLENSEIGFALGFLPFFVQLGLLLVRVGIL